MKSVLYHLLTFLMILALAACENATTPLASGPDVFANFAGTTPCTARPLPQIPADSDCNQMLWRIVLHREPASGDPTTYELHAAFGVSKQGTPDLEGGGTHVDRTGKWEIANGTRADPEATVYRLALDDPPAALSFVKLSDDIIHLLDPGGDLVVGNGAWAYTLNRMDPRIPSQANAGRQPESDGPTRPPAPPVPAGQAVFGVFDGRTPCDPAVVGLTMSSPGCLKIKWRLSLYQEGNTGAPGGYLFMGTSFYTQGRWSILHGIPRDPEAVVYRLDPDHVQTPLFLLKVDENHLFILDGDLDFLVGNEFFSYTLSRNAQPEP